MAAAFQAVFLGPWISMTGSKKMGILIKAEDMAFPWWHFSSNDYIFY